MVIEKQEEEEEEEEVEDVVEQVVEVVAFDIFAWKPPVRKKKRKPQSFQDIYVYVPPPLVVSEISANETGAVFIEFSKPIFTPEPY